MLYVSSVLFIIMRIVISDNREGLISFLGIIKFISLFFQYANAKCCSFPSKLAG